MLSPEGEKVIFSSKINCENGVEQWLKKAEINMKDTLRRLVKICRE